MSINFVKIRDIEEYKKEKFKP
ncbi:hypothetical protein DAC15_104 [Bacteroides phage DAC15]|nr:hypothetical protein KNU90_gp035 [Bacteroides phage DAC15]QIN96283.1 hypothetical protein DAC15_104 [Bacteroides phage DAC15]QIN96400.1 hypothetical protein DAC17_101 [Bacteroides phage DAC17]